MAKSAAYRVGQRRGPTAAQALVVNQLARSRARFEAVVLDVHAQRHRRRWLPGAWSLNDLLEHLVLVEGPLEHFLSGRWLACVKAGQLPACRHPADTVVTYSGLHLTPSAIDYAPSGLVDFPALWEQSCEIRQRLLSSLRKSYGVAWSSALITRPGFGGVRATLHQWLLWTAEYETKHALALEAQQDCAGRQQTAGAGEIRH